MEPLTPPPSLPYKCSVTRLRANSNQNANKTLAPMRASSPATVKPSSQLHLNVGLNIEQSRPPSRGRARVRARSKPALTLPIAHQAGVPHGPLVFVSPTITPTPVNEDEMLFPMSPIKPQPTVSLFADSAVSAVGMESEDNAKALAAIWKGHERLGARRTRTRARTRTRTRTGNGGAAMGLTRLQELQFHPSPHPQNIPINRPCTDDFESGGKEEDQPFMYSFPVFESTPLRKAKDWRARRLASGNINASPCRENLAVTDEQLKPLNESRIELQASNDNQTGDDINNVGEKDESILSSAFRSHSLDDDADASDDDDCASKQSFSTSQVHNNGDSFVMSRSLLSSFPMVLPHSTRMKTSTGEAYTCSHHADASETGQFASMAYPAVSRDMRVSFVGTKESAHPRGRAPIPAARTEGAWAATERTGCHARTPIPILRLRDDAEVQIDDSDVGTDSDYSIGSKPFHFDDIEEDEKFAQKMEELSVQRDVMERGRAQRVHMRDW